MFSTTHVASLYLGIVWTVSILTRVEDTGALLSQPVQNLDIRRQKPSFVAAKPLEQV